MPEPKIITNKKILISFLVVLFLVGLGWQLQAAQASNTQERDPKLGGSGSPIILPGQPVIQATPAAPSNFNCIMCHQYEKLYGVTRDSMQFSLTFDEHNFAQSVHGKQGIPCVSCHTTITEYPHTGVEQVSCEDCHEKNISVTASLPYDDRRIMEIHLNETCLNCHPNEYSGKNVHSSVEADGQVNTPLCTDCHGGHDVQSPADPPARITSTW